jgi:hypothetical protein
MIGGSLIVGVSLLVLGWTAEIVGYFVEESETVYQYIGRLETSDSNTRSPEKPRDHCRGRTEHLRCGFRNQCWYLITTFCQRLS